jgi:sarcosine oxidase delta subunit
MVWSRGNTLGTFAPTTERRMIMVELKPCEYCGEKPELQRGLEFDTLMTKYRYNCPRCNIQSKSAYTIDGAAGLWNENTEDKKL